MNKGTKEGEIADPDVKAVMEEMEAEKAEKATPPEPPAPPAPVEPEPEPAKEEKAPEPQEPQNIPPPPEASRPVEGEEPWRRKQAEKKSIREQEALERQELKEQIATVNQRFENVVTKDDLAEIKQLIAQSAQARTSQEKGEASDDFEEYIASLNDESQKFARKLMDKFGKPVQPALPEELTRSEERRVGKSV